MRVRKYLVAKIDHDRLMVPMLFWALDCKKWNAIIRIGREDKNIRNFSFAIAYHLVLEVASGQGELGNLAVVSPCLWRRTEWSSILPFKKAEMFFWDWKKKRQLEIYWHEGFRSGWHDLSGIGSCSGMHRVLRDEFFWCFFFFCFQSCVLLLTMLLLSQNIFSFCHSEIEVAPRPILC